MKQDIEISRRAVLAGTVGGIAVFTAGLPGSAAVAVPTGTRPGRLPDRSRSSAPSPPPSTGSSPGAEEDDRPRGGGRPLPPRDRRAARRVHGLAAADLRRWPVLRPRRAREHNDFADFLPLDRYETEAWRVRIEGSRGRKRFERNGKVDGLPAHLPTGARGARGVRPRRLLPGPRPGPGPRDARREQPRRRRRGRPRWSPTPSSSCTARRSTAATGDLVGWTTTDFDGDVQPRGWTREQVENPEPSPPLDLVDDLLGGFLGGTAPGLAAPVVAMGSTESVHGVRARRR